METGIAFQHWSEYATSVLTLVTYRGDLDSDIDLANAIAEVGDNYRPVLARAIDAQADVIGVPREVLMPRADTDPYTSVRVSQTELLTADGGVIIVSLESNRGPAAGPLRLALYGFGTSDLEQPLENLVSFMSERLQCELKRQHFTSDKFTQLVNKGMRTATEPAMPESAGAALLSDPAARRAAIGVAQSGGGLLVGDFAKQLDIEDRTRADEIRAQLEDKGIIKKDYVVVCTRNASQVLRAASREAIYTAANSGTTCACGRSLTDEQIESAVNLDDLGRTLLNGSRWMSLVLIEALKSLGIGYDSIVVDQKAGSDEIDCFADISGELCLFELKDKEFSLGNAYSFGAKVGIHRPRYAVVVTTAQVGNDAKEHFDMAQSASRDERFGPEPPSEIRYIEGIEGLLPTLEQLIGDIYAMDARQALRPCLSFASIAPASLVKALRQSGVSRLEAA